MRSIDYRGLGKRAEKERKKEGKEEEKKGGGGAGGRREGEKDGQREWGWGEVVYVCVERETEREGEELDCIYFFKKKQKKNLAAVQVGRCL